MCVIAGMSAVLHSRHVGCVTQQTYLLSRTADMSGVPHSRPVCCVTQQSPPKVVTFLRPSANSKEKPQGVTTNGMPLHFVVLEVFNDVDRLFVNFVLIVDIQVDKGACGRSQQEQDLTNCNH